MVVEGDFVETEQSRSKVLRKSGYPSMPSLAQLQRDGSGSSCEAIKLLLTADRCE